MSRISLTYISLFLSASALYAQETERLPPPGPTPGTSGRAFGAVFLERHLNTFNWFGRAFIDTSFGNFSLNMNEQYTSSTILIDATSTSPEKRPESNQQELSLLPGWNISHDVTLLSQWSSLVYSDNKAVGLSRASYYNLYGGARYSPSDQFFVNPMAGYRWDNQGAFNDQGLSYDITAGTTPNLEFDSYRLSGDFRFNQDRIEPRLLENYLGRVGLQKSFIGATRDSIEFQYSRTRRDFYSLSAAPVDTNIESRVDEILSFANLLYYEVDRGFLTTFAVGVIDRHLDKDIRYNGTGTQITPQFSTAIEEFLLNAYVQALYHSDDGQAFALARFQYNERNETHSAKPLAGAPDALYREVNDNEKTKDNLTRRTTLTGSLRFPISRSDALGLSGSAGVLRYDTPDVQNVEDRDEQLLTLALTTSHNLTQNLDFGISLSGSVSHIVYLLSERSANNNYNRVIRLVPRTVFRPLRGTSTMNAFEVLANYTVYDYEEQAALIRSFSYRQFSWLDSTQVQLNERFGLDFSAFLKLYERGQLMWNDFTERTSDSFVDETYAGQVRFSPVANLTFGIGLRYFAQTRYTYDNAMKEFDSRIESIGPTCLIDWRASNRSLIYLSGWYEERRQPDGTRQTLPNLTLTTHLTL